MSSPEDQKGAQAPDAGSAPSPDANHVGNTPPAAEPAQAESSSQTYDDYPYEDSYDTSDSAPASATTVTTTAVAPPPVASGGGRTPPSPPPSSTDDEDDDEGMLRMSFLEHLEELRARIIKALMGVGVAFVASLIFTNELWAFVCQPAIGALKSLGYTPSLVQITPMESFNVIWVKLPILCAVFLSSPWILYQVWAFIAPGLYHRERRWAAPFVLCSAGLFIGGGVFAYFVAFRYGLTFLLSIGRGNYVTPMVSITEYFDLFVNVILGVGLVFELPVLIFFLSLLRIVTPSFLIRNSRYAILLIFIVAAVVTPTPDVFNLMLFATPMVLLFYVGIFASYLLLLHRENRRFPWRIAILIVAGVLLLVAAVLYLAITRYGWQMVPHWPFLVR